MNKIATLSVAILILMGISSCGKKDEAASTAPSDPGTGASAVGTSTCPGGKCESAEYEGFLESSPYGRYTETVTKAQRFTSKPLDTKRIEYLCGDMDGCTVRLGMYNWDNQMRVASREGLLYYNRETRRWRSSQMNIAGGGANDVDGTDFDGSTQHVLQAWACFVTDAEYVNRSESDTKRGFGLLSWDNNGAGSAYNADCWVTFID